MIFRFEPTHSPPVASERLTNSFPLGAPVVRGWQCFEGFISLNYSGL